jgi:hypothetical protein
LQYDAGEAANAGFDGTITRSAKESAIEERDCTLLANDLLNDVTDPPRAREALLAFQAAAVLLRL